MIKLIALFFVLISPAAWAATSEGYGMGGWMYKLQPVIDKANASGELFRIVGHCQSACTTFLGIRNVCIERNATLLFHAGHDDKWQISSIGPNGSRVPITQDCETTSPGGTTWKRLVSTPFPAPS